MENKITKSLVIIGGGPAGLAAAVAAAAEKTGRIKKGEILTVETPGGITETEVTDGGIMISGDAHTVFRGVFDDEDK